MSRRNTISPSLPLLLIMGWLAAMLGCAGSPSAPATGDAPAGSTAHRGLTLTMQATTTTGRHTYFELDDQGMLWYGGGRHAAAFRAEPAGQLTEQQLDTLWQIIEDHNLLKAGDRPFARPQQVTYQVQIRHPAGRRSFRAIDDQVPGLKQLHDTLFEYQADLRY